MPRKLRCSRCAKIFVLPAEDTRDRVLCLACGTWIPVPPALRLSNAPPASANTAPAPAPHSPETLQASAHVPNVFDESQPSGEQDWVEWAASPPTRQQRRQPPIQRRSERQGLIWGLAAAGGLCILLGVILLLTRRPSAPGEQPHRDQPVQSEADASALAKAKRLPESPSAQKQSEKEASGQSNQDPHPPQETDQARTSQDHVLPTTQNLGTDSSRAQSSAPQTQTPPSTAPSPPAEAVAPADAPLDTPAPVAVVRRPPIQPVPLNNDAAVDEQIGQAISLGVDYVLSQFEGPQLRQSPERTRYYAGFNALAVYALLQSGQAINDPRLNVRGQQMKAIVNRMKQIPIEPQFETYSRAIRAAALALYNRPEDRETLKEDVNWLIKASENGAYTYSAPTAPSDTPMVWDNSNSQYGLLGVWSGAETGVEVPQSYWKQVQKHWTDCQSSSGEWAYRTPAAENARPSMTLAGLASLFVTHDYLDAPSYANRVGREPFPPALARGLAWLENGDNCMQVRSAWGGYTLYGLERVGLASGFKFFGRHDWYRELAASVVARQGRDGSIGELIETSYSLLFLARGRHPILMNKLRFDGYWANRPRDLANLARFATKELERPLNWQVVSLSRDWVDWMDSPIVYLASHEKPSLTDADYAKLRQFVEAGGMIYTQSDGGSLIFNRFVVELASKLFPAYEWTDLPPNHDIYTVNFQVNPKPRLRCVTNGSRILMIHSPDDLASAWQQRAEKTRRAAFDLGVNLFLYATGKVDLRNRLSSPYLPPPKGNAACRIKLARLRYAGAWDPEPHAFVRFARWFEYQTGYALDAEATDIAQLQPEQHPIAHITGTVQYTPSDAQIAALKEYVEAGGILVIDACGGAHDFDYSIETLFLPRMFPGKRAAILAPDHPVLAGGAEGMRELPRPLLRPYAENKLGRRAGQMQILTAGKGAVIYSSLDLTTGLLGVNTWGILGYRPGYAQDFMKNLILWVTDGGPSQAAKK